MTNRRYRTPFSAVLGFLLLVVGSARATPEMDQQYQTLVDLFEEWRAFEAPMLTEGVPDYTAATMATKREELEGYFARLNAIQTDGWSVERQIDHRLVEAEMNGFKFELEVTRPWAEDPAYYMTVWSGHSDVPEHEGPNVHPPIDLWAYDYPLSKEDQAELAAKFRATEPLLAQARINLAGSNARDLWVHGVRSIRDQADLLASYAAGEVTLNDLGGYRPAPMEGVSEDFLAAIKEAEDATRAFADWVEEQSKTKTGASGMGRENYTWYLQNVHLVPYTWEDEVALLRRELERAHAALILEEHRNRKLATLEPAKDAKAYARLNEKRFKAYMKFLRDEEIVPDEPFMEAAIKAQIGSFVPAERRNFFHKAMHREPQAMYTHFYHWVDLARMRDEPHDSPIRRVASLYNIFDSRAEGMATAFEEIVMHAGLYDDNPRAREIVYIMLAQRAARGLASLYVHANEMILEEAGAFQARWTPRGWMSPDEDLIAWEQLFYLRQPVYGTSYVSGKLLLDRMMMQYHQKLQEAGETFVLKEFFEEYVRAGMIPMSTIIWELTGEEAGILKLGE